MAFEAVRQRRFGHAPPPVIVRAQERRVRAAVAFAKAHVPYYRETLRRLILGPDEIADARGLARLPILERDQLQRDPEFFLSELSPPDACVQLQSGGTTGAPVTVFLDGPSLFRMAAQRERMRIEIARLCGRWAYREAHVVPADSSAATASHAVRTRTLLPRRVRVEQQSFSMLRAPGEVVCQLADYRPDVITTYGSYLEALFTHVREHQPSFPPPKVAVYTSDSFSPALLEWTRGCLGVEVLGSYGAIEAAEIGFECRHHAGYHLNVDLYPIRAIDAQGRDCAPGEAGEVVVSNLVNRGTMLLNYRLGDVVAIDASPCHCGRTLPLCSYIERTKTAWLHLGDGEPLHAQALRAVLRHEQQVWRYQLIQEGPRSLLLRLVVDPACGRAATTERIHARFIEVLPAGSRVRVQFVSDLPQGPSGKVQPVVGWPGPGAPGSPPRQ